MAKKKQNRIVAGQNKARERAKRKSKNPGSAASSYQALSNSDDNTNSEAPPVVRAENQGQTVSSVSDANAQANPTAPSAIPGKASRPSQGNLAISQSSLKSEVLRIGIISATVGLVLAALKLSSF